MNIEERQYLMEEMEKNKKEVQEVKCELTSLRNEICDLRNDVRGLVTAWNTASGVVSFIKWASGLALAVYILWNHVIDLVKFVVR